MTTQRDRKLDDLQPQFRVLVDRMLGKFVEACIPIMIVETLRSHELHLQDIANKRSWVGHSKHEDGLAIDICPYESYLLHGDDKLQWDSSDPIWQKLGAIGESINLGWGGRWTQKDMGHFELKSISVPQRVSV